MAKLSCNNFHFRKLFLLLFILNLCGKSFAQNVENSGWLTLINNTKLSERWGVGLDLQLRSSDEIRSLKNFILRPGVTYYINKSSNVTVGYMLNRTYFNQIQPSIGQDLKTSLTENRIWEQYIFTHKISSIFVSHRFRLEQRFIEQQNTDIFSQRFRYFFRLIQPLKKKQEKFTDGAFVALQNEIFLGLQNKSKLNNKFFEQNRAYLALGYRFSPKIDIEMGYLNQSIRGLNSHTTNNVIQFAIYTRF